MKFDENNIKQEFIKVKHRGKVYTPDFLVKIILNQGNYNTEHILSKHVIDNSCGDGQFLIQIINRYCIQYKKKYSDIKNLKQDLETYIHGIEIDEKELEICKKRCELVANIHRIYNVNWDFINEDALKVSKYNNKMDFVSGNPPYVRVHNFNENFDDIKKFQFASKGMSDLFIVFYEIGINMLSDTGTLCYITPSSFFQVLLEKY